MTRTPSDDAGLFPPFRHDAPETSAQAARSMAEVAPNLRAMVLSYLRDRGARGSTDDEGVRALRLRVTTYSARRCELAGLGAVVDSGERRATSSGRSAIVWVASEFAQAGGGA